VAAEQIRILILVAGRYQFLQTQLRKVVSKIVEEITCARVVAIAEHRFLFEVLNVVRQFSFDVGKDRVELVVLIAFRFVQKLVGRVSCHFI
jgi:hypothetical protein